MNNAIDNQATYLTVAIKDQRPGTTVGIMIDTDAETITAWIDGLPYVFEIGSDDDEYVFVYGDDVIVIPLEE